MVLPPLPPAPSWFPGHMASFTKALPTLLANTHVVIEARDARLPLTSINPTLETALAKWRVEKERLGANSGAGVCERIVVYTKRDLVSSKGEKPLESALKRYFDHRIHFNSTGSPRDLRALHSSLVSIAEENKETTPHLNILIVGMPNIGKSTLLNNLRWAGTSISTKALRTSAQPGLTRALSERLKLNLDPPIYAVDSPGVMVPFLGRGDEGRERGVKLALIAGIKESLYDVESLAAYLLYKLNRLNPENPAYLPILPKSAQKPVQDLEEFLYLVAERLGSIRKGGEYDLERTARWFVGWWREGKASQWPETHGWGFDFDFSSYSEQEGIRTLQEKMDEYVSRYVERMRSVQDGIEMSPTREKRLAREEKKKARDAKRQAAYEAKKLGSGVAKKPT